MLALFFLSLRIKKPIGEVHHIPFLKEEEIRTFLLEHDKSILIFTDGQFKYDFANFAIHKFKDRIAFAAVSIEDGQKYNAQGPLSIFAFYKSNIVKLPAAPFSAIDFTNWCDNAFAKSSIQIVHPEELRVIFSSTITCCFGVDINARPEKLRDDITFYNVPHQFFHYFAMNISKGYYIYRSADRQLVKMGKDPNKFIATKVTDLHSSNLVKKPYYGGFFMNRGNVTACQIESDLLNTIANKYNEEFYFGPLAGKLAHTIALQYNLINFPLPFFAVFDSKGRWILDGEKAHNIEALTELIEQIKNKKINYTQMNDDSSKLSKNIKTLSFSNVMDTINNDGKDSVLYITANCGPRCILYNELMKSTAKIFKDTTVNFYMLNASSNEIPQPLDPNMRLPTFFEWPANKKAWGPLEYDGGGDIKDFARFIQVRSCGPFEEPKFNATKINLKARTRAYKINFKHSPQAVNATVADNTTDFTKEL